MNGVRRFLGAATGSSPPSSEPQPSPTAPLAFGSKTGPTWPPQSPTTGTPQQPPLPAESPKTTAALFLRKDRSRSQPPEEDPSNSSIRSSNAASLMSHTRGQTSFSASSPTRPISGPNSPAAGPSSPRALPNRVVTRKSVNHAGSEMKRNSGNMNTRDELLISLLASEAVVDSRDFEILSSEEVEDLKKEQQVLTSRLGAMTKKLSLETKIRDAAISLTKVNTSHKKISKQTDEQLEAANRRVDAAQKELWRISERTNDVYRKLLEHRAGVLSISVRSMEKKMAPRSSTDEESSHNTSNRSTLMSPTTSSVTSASSSSKTRFDGAHLFAGHADAVIPRRALSSEAAAAEIASLEEKLKAATETLAAAGKKQADMARELSHMRLEKQEVETMMGMELQSAEDTITALEKELPRLEGLDSEVQDLLTEKKAWEMERRQLEERARQTDALRAQLTTLEATTGEAAGAEKVVAESSRRELEDKESEIERLKAEWERAMADVEDEKMEDLARLQDEMDRLRDEDGAALQKANQELNDGVEFLRTLVNRHGIVLFSRAPSLQGLLESIGTHLEGMHSKLEANSTVQGEWEALRLKLEGDIRSGLDKREALARELEGARRERDEAKRETRVLEARVKEQSDVVPVRSPPTPLATFAPVEYTGDASKIVSILQPIWAILPSPEARAAKFSNTRQYRTGSPTATNSPGTAVASLSDLDVRSLKSLYDSRSNNLVSPKPSVFSVEAFAARVQALITDDRALIERLVRFAQAHDLLKKNAERAQKLAQEGNTALETYQKQVRTLEERNTSLSTKQAVMQDEVQRLQDAIDRITAEKLEVEMHAAEQAETCRQLTEANNTLSARTLTLAEEAASAPEMVRKQLEGQLTECRATLEAAQKEVDAMRMSEQSQRIALLDELNSMQTENGALRAQLRAVKK